MKFPETFLFGAATSSYQIEGDRTGRGDCIWDDFCSTGKVLFGHNGDVCCDHVNRMQEDVKLMRTLKLQAYRFSVAWPRVLPDGTGKVNVEGLDFYDRLTDTLLENGIQPFCTLYHWDLPLALERRGGWRNRDIADWFADYAAIVAERLGDRVGHFMTLNEPQCFVSLGYWKGVHAPGLTLSRRELLSVIHNVLLAHGKGVQAVRANAPKSQVGIAMVSNAHYPATAADVEAARKAVLSLHGNYDNWVYNVVHWCDPIYFGAYPEESYREFGDDMPTIGADDMRIISSPIDFHGENVYNGCCVRDDGNGSWRVVDFPKGFAKNSLGWAVTPESLRWPIRFLYERYAKPIYITENGMCCHDFVAADGTVPDCNRVDFMRRYLTELAKAIDDGADVRGYFAWSLLDNFEWAYGFSERFGLVYVDYETQRRIPKQSALFYRDFIAARGGRK